MTRPPRIVDAGDGRDSGAGRGSGVGSGSDEGRGLAFGRRRGDRPGAPASGSGRLHVVRHAPAKLNLTLAVVGRRSDGYHSLHSVMVPLTLGDALTLSAAPAGATEDALTVSGLSLAATPDNLVLRAIVATRAAVESAGAVPAGQADAGPAQPVGTPFLAARLVKRIPMAAGLGGGSSDAAAAIDAALAVWNVTLTTAQATELAAGLGSDVPFFLARGAALVTGRGEFVEPLPDIAGEPPAVLLVTPRLPVATASVFAAYTGGARRGPTSPALGISERLASAMRTGVASADLLNEAAELARANDLMTAAASVAPGLGAFVTALAKLVGRPVCQSGSGPTLWSLYPTLAEARKAVRFVRLAAVNGTLPPVGSGEPFVAATTIAGRSTPPAVSPPDGTTGTIRPRTVHNGFDAAEHGPEEPAG